MARDLAKRAEQAVAQRGGEDRPSLQKQLQSMEAQFQRAMPKGIEAVQLIRDVMTCVKNTPKLAQCDPMTVLGSAMTCAQLGLRPGVGALGHAWILPFYDYKTKGQKAQLIIGYKGYVELGHRSDKIGSLNSRIVYANDEFDVEYGAAEDRWIHKPYFTVGHDTPGEARLFYAVGRLANGGYSLTDPMTVADMEAHRDKFAMAKDRNQQVVGPWRDHFEAMGKKTMLLRLMALMPKSTDIQRAMDNDGSVRLDLSPGGIDQPEVVDGEYLGDAEPEPEPAAERQPQRERVTVKSSRGDDVPPPPEPPADDDPAQTVVMVSEDQLMDLARIRKDEKIDDDASWLSLVGGGIGRKVAKLSDLTAAEAETVIGMFSDDAGNDK